MSLRKHAALSKVALSIRTVRERGPFSPIPNLSDILKMLSFLSVRLYCGEQRQQISANKAPEPCSVAALHVELHPPSRS